MAEGRQEEGPRDPNSKHYLTSQSGDLVLLSQKIAITGGLGFIGGHLARRLASAGHHVVLADIRAATNGSTRVGPGSIDVCRMDIRDPSTVSKPLAGSRIIFHLAALKEVVASRRTSEDIFSTNVAGTQSVLEAAKRAGANRFVFASSMAVYGEHVNPVSERSRLKPISAYGRSKLKAEELCSKHGDPSFHTVVMRICNVYGEGAGEDENDVISNFADAARGGRPLTIFGDGNQTRDFVHVSDVVDAFVSVGEKEPTGARVFNIGTGVGTSINQLADLFQAHFRHRLKVRRLPPRKGEIRHSVADITLARRTLGYSPHFSLKAGVREYLASLRQGSRPASARALR